MTRGITILVLLAVAFAPLARATVVEPPSPAATVAATQLPMFEPEAEWKQILPGQHVPGVRRGPSVAAITAAH